MRDSIHRCLRVVGRTSHTTTRGECSSTVAMRGELTRKEDPKDNFKSRLVCTLRTAVFNVRLRIVPLERLVERLADADRNQVAVYVEIHGYHSNAMRGSFSTVSFHGTPRVLWVAFFGTLGRSCCC